MVAVCGWLLGPFRNTHRPPRGELRITSGATQGVYNAFATELAHHLTADDSRLQVSVLRSTGSVQNLQRIAAGQADCGLTAGDAAALAYAGKAPFGHPLPISAVGRVYDDYIQLVARPGSGITSVAGLRGKSVSLGSPGSGVELISARILTTAGISTRQLRAAALGINESLEAFRRGEIDAFFWSGGLPTSAVADLISATHAYLVPLTDVAAGMTAGFDTVYRTATIPAGVYVLAAPLSTLAVPNLIVCNTAFDDRIVEYLTSTLFGAQAKIASVVPPVNVIDQRSAIATDPVPLHPGALRWYRRSKD